MFGCPCTPPPGLGVGWGWGVGEREGPPFQMQSFPLATWRTSSVNNDSIFHGRHSGQEVGVRTAEETRTLAVAIDALIRGELPQVGELLAQRLKALETSVEDRSWAVANNLEVCDDGRGLASLEERQAAARHTLLHQKVAEAKNRLAARNPGAS